MSSGTQGDASLARFTAQRARFVTSDAVLGTVAETLGRTDLTALRHEITALPSASSNTIAIEVVADTDTEAVAFADAVIAAYRLQTEAQFARLTAAAIESIDATEADLTARLAAAPSPAAATATADTISQLRLEASRLRTAQVLFGDGVEFVNAPRLDAVVTPSFPLREAGLGLVVGLILAATVAWLRADRDRGIDNPVELEAALGVPSLGQLSDRTDLHLINPIHLEATPSHDYRLVWSALVRQRQSGVVILASEGVDSRSVAALNLAAAAARDNRSVLLVDADFRTRQISFALADGSANTEWWESPQGRKPDGLSSVLQTEGNWRDAVVELSGAGMSLSFLPAGSLNENEIRISTQQIETYVQEWRSSYDLVFIDAEGVGSSQLNALLYGAADGALVVVGEGTERDVLASMLRAVSLQGTELVGGVFATLS